MVISYQAIFLRLSVTNSIRCLWILYHHEINSYLIEYPNLVSLYRHQISNKSSYPNLVSLYRHQISNKSSPIPGLCEFLAMISPTLLWATPIWFWLLWMLCFLIYIYTFLQYIFHMSYDFPFGYFLKVHPNPTNKVIFISSLY